MTRSLTRLTPLSVRHSRVSDPSDTSLAGRP
jgi:hypothetical protein